MPTGLRTNLVRLSDGMGGDRGRSSMDWISGMYFANVIAHISDVNGSIDRGGLVRPVSGLGVQVPGRGAWALPTSSFASAELKVPRVERSRPRSRHGRLQALGVYEAARQAGLRIPDDLSVVGFDDIDQATWVAPPLTTVRQPFAEMGTTLIVRGSTAPPRAPRAR